MVYDMVVAMTRLFTSLIFLALATSASHGAPICLLDNGERVICGDAVGITVADHALTAPSAQTNVCFIKLNDNIPDGKSIMAYFDGYQCHPICIVGYICGPTP